MALGLWSLAIESLRTQSRQLPANKALWVFFSLALLLHAVVLSVPIVREVSRVVSVHDALQLELRRAPEPVVSAAPPPEPTVAPEPVRPPQPVPAEPAVEVPPVLQRPVEQQSPDPVAPALPENLARRLLSDQYDSDKALRQPVFADPNARPDQSTPDYVMYLPDSLDDVLNQPVTQLPFQDTRIYLVDHYDDGFLGGMQKFWNTVTVPFGFTTKNNTRIQCAWVMVFAACGWGHKTQFYRPAEKRKKEQGEDSGS